MLWQHVLACSFQWFELLRSFVDVSLQCHNRWQFETDRLASDKVTGFL